MPSTDHVVTDEMVEAGARRLARRAAVLHQDTWNPREPLSELQLTDAELDWRIHASVARLVLEAALAAPPSPAGQVWKPSKAAEDVLAERRRQIEVEGWTADHDDKHFRGEMASAAGLYAINVGHEGIRLKDQIAGVPKQWPWHRNWWKPTDRRRSLVKAAALAIAEIERLDRLPSPPETASPGDAS